MICCHHTSKITRCISSCGKNPCWSLLQPLGSLLQIMKKLTIEFIGTFFLVFTIGMVVVATPTGVIPPLAIGAVLLAMIFAGGHISGAHYNPAVSLAMLIRGKVALGQMIGYWVAQVAGALIAALLVAWLKGSPANAAVPAITAQVFVVEFLFTFALCFVILNVATSKGTANNSFYGLAIAAVVVGGAFAVGSISGAAFNPAVVLGAALMGLIHPTSILFYLAANFAAAAAAAFVFRFVSDEDKAVA